MADEPYVTIEFPAVGASYRHEEYGVYRYSTYEAGTVNEGLEKRSALGRYDTLAEAQRRHPEARREGEGVSGFRDIPIPRTAPGWFREDDIGEVWSADEDYPEQ